jgi:hypothetical protein
MEQLNKLYTSKVAEYEAANAAAKQAYEEGSPDTLRLLMTKDAILMETYAIADQMAELARRNNPEPL